MESLGLKENPLTIKDWEKPETTGVYTYCDIPLLFLRLLLWLLLTMEEF